MKLSSSSVKICRLNCIRFPSSSYACIPSSSLLLLLSIAFRLPFSSSFSSLQTSPSSSSNFLQSRFPQNLPLLPSSLSFPSSSLGIRGFRAFSTCRIMEKPRKLSMDPFCYRQFESETYIGTNLPIAKEAFLKKVNEMLMKEEIALVDGYAAFCKHLFIENFTDCEISVASITEDNEKLLKSGYFARTPEELPVLTRWFNKAELFTSGKPPKAKFLDLILYSREQVEKESQAMDKKVELSEYFEGNDKNADWSIISIKAQDEAFETPMAPITMMRNTLITEGGSGVSIDRKKYLEAVEYWKHHAMMY